MSNDPTLTTLKIEPGHKPGWYRISRPGKAGAAPWYLFPFMWLWIKLP